MFVLSFGLESTFSPIYTLDSLEGDDSEQECRVQLTKQNETAHKVAHFAFVDGETCSFLEKFQTHFKLWLVISFKLSSCFTSVKILRHLQVLT